MSTLSHFRLAANRVSITIIERQDEFECETNTPITHNYVCFITNYESEVVKHNGLRE